jgi:hypothetical protein
VEGVILLRLKFAKAQELGRRGFVAPVGIAIMLAIAVLYALFRRYG